MGKRIVWIASCAFAGLALSFAGLTSARTGQNTNSSTTMAQGNMNRNDNGGNMNGRSGAASSQDRKFVMNAAMSDMFEIESSRLALERATSDHVKQMAQQLIDDHTRASGELMQLAQPKGLTPPAGLDGKHASMLTRLRAMSGAEFEREYVRQAGVKAHEQAVKLFRDQSRKGRDAELRAFAARTLPALEGHLQAARSHGNMTGMHGGGGMNSNGGGSMNGNSRDVVNDSSGGVGTGTNRNSNRGSNRNANRNSNANMGGGNSNNGNTNNSNR